MNFSAITIVINAENDSFQDDNLHSETARILRDLADQIERGWIPRTVRDSNGNTTGQIGVRP